MNTQHQHQTTASSSQSQRIRADHALSHYTFVASQAIQHDTSQVSAGHHAYFPTPLPTPSTGFRPSVPQTVSYIFPPEQDFHQLPAYNQIPPPPQFSPAVYSENCYIPSETSWDPSSYAGSQDAIYGPIPEPHAYATEQNVHNDLNPVIWAGASSNRNSTSVWGNTLQIPDAGQTPLTPSSSTSSPSMSSNSHLHPASTDAQHAITCDQCGKGPFGRQYELKRHQTYVHHPPRWTCGICGNCFKRKDDCQRHLRRQHETEVLCCGGAVLCTQYMSFP